MRITENRLRSIIRRVLVEMNALGRTFECDDVCGLLRLHGILEPNKKLRPEDSHEALKDLSVRNPAAFEDFERDYSFYSSEYVGASDSYFEENIVPDYYNDLKKIVSQMEKIDLV